MWLLRKIAFPFSLVYGWVVWVRNRLYDRGILTSKSYGTPILCVGNLSVGGTGKTPMVEYLIRNLPDKKVAVLSRGYKRKSVGYLLADKKTTVAELGDEPYQIFSKFPKVSMAVDADRRNGIEQLEKTVAPHVIVLDDAFQHRRVHPDFSILLTSYGMLYVDDWYLPTGDLRDSKSAAKRAHCIVVTKCPGNLSDTQRRTILKRIAPRPGQHVFFSTLSYGDIQYLDGTSVKIEDMGKRKITLVTGIANPDPLKMYLQSNGLSYEHMRFPDHHNFTAKELEVLRSKENILTTEKDFVRLRDKLTDLYYLPVQHRFLHGDGEKFNALISQFLN